MPNAKHPLYVYASQDCVTAITNAAYKAYQANENAPTSESVTTTISTISGSQDQAVIVLKEVSGDLVDMKNALAEIKIWARIT